jgi:abortive infection bacteriophage resistance protein
MPDRRIPFTKPALSLDEQVALLERRGLHVSDRDRAKHYLNFIGYYRLGGYAKHFQIDSQTHQFADGCEFDDILNLYIFDRKLRHLLADALERIEVAVKAHVSNAASLQDGAFWLLNPANFDRGVHGRILGEIDQGLGPDPRRNPHMFIQHFYNRYGSPEYPPSWMLMETISFGALSRIYKCTKGNLRSSVAKEFSLHHNILESWLHFLTYTRNVCAHHNMIWSRDFTITPKIPKYRRDVWPAESGNKLFVACGIIKHFMTVISDGSRWPERLAVLIDGRGKAPLAAMGFPEDWKERL